MATGSDSAPMFPWDGNFLIKGRVAADDILTLQGVASQTGDFLALRNSSETEKFVVSSTGVLEKFKVRVQNKTADYTCVEADSGSFFTNVGATVDVTFTLPATADMVNGEFYVFISAADAIEFKVAGGTADKLVAYNDVAADSVAFSTSGEYVGGWFMAVCDGSLWHVAALLGSDLQTITVAT